MFPRAAAHDIARLVIDCVVDSVLPSTDRGGTNQSNCFPQFTHSIFTQNNTKKILKMLPQSFWSVSYSS